MKLPVAITDRKVRKFKTVNKAKWREITKKIFELLPGVTQAPD